MPQFPPTEVGLGAPLPVDRALSLNGRTAAVRSAINSFTTAAPYNNGLTVWNLTSTTAATLITGAQAMGEGTYYGFAGYRPSDLVDMNNAVVVAISSGYSAWSTGTQDQTYIDVIALSATPTHFPFTLGRTSSAIANNQAAGYTNDVEIARDGGFAIVNADNWIFAVGLPVGATPTVKALNIGEFPYGNSTAPGDPAALCSPNGIVDSVVIAGDFAVVTTARLDLTSFPGTPVVGTWVYIVDVANSAVVLEQHVMPPAGTPAGQFPTAGHEVPGGIGADIHPSLKPHDIAVTPDGGRAVVSSDRMVSLFDLTTSPPSYLGSHYDRYASRKYQLQVDSVEVSDTRAVVICDESSGGAPFPQIDVFDISPSVTALGVPIFNDVDGAGGRAHDLELGSPSQRNKGVVRTSIKTIVVDLPAAGAITVKKAPSPNGSNAHEYVNFEQSQGEPLFSSDSVQLFNNTQVTPNVLVAMTIGAVQTAPLSGVWRGYVDFIDVNASPATMLQNQAAITGPGGASDQGAIPLDVAVTRDRQELAVRSFAKLANAPTSPGGDVTFFSTSTYSALADYGGTGHVMGVDSVQAGTNAANGRKRIISVSEDRITPDGKVHFVDRP